MIIKTVDLEKKMREEEEFDENIVLENKAPDIHILINKYIVEKNMLHKDIIRALNVERSYGYQLLNGKRTPTRNQIVRIALILKLNFDQVQRLLKTAKKDVLYPRNMTDAKIIYALEHDMDYESACEFIWNE